MNYRYFLRLWRIRGFVQAILDYHMDTRRPDFIIRKPTNDFPYLLRWWIIPRNKYFNIYLHCFLDSDFDHILHDHPWNNISLILKGEYREEFEGQVFKIRKKGDWTFRKATVPHRIHIDDHNTCWSLFMTGRIIREWGFHCPNGWRPWKLFVRNRDDVTINNGCG